MEHNRSVADDDFPDEIFISFERIGSHVKFFQWTSTISFLVINFFIRGRFTTDDTAHPEKLELVTIPD